jgi:hypothetical protein
MHFKKLNEKQVSMACLSVVMGVGKILLILEALFYKRV